MKFTCPNCNEQGVSAVAKLHSSPYKPAICQLCSKPSAEPALVNLITGSLLGVVIVFLSLGFSLQTKSWWPLIAGLVCWVLLEVLALFTTPLRKISSNHAKTAQKRILIFAFLFVTALLLFRLMSN